MLWKVGSKVFSHDIMLAGARGERSVAVIKAGGRRDALFDGKPNLRATRTRERGRASKFEKDFMSERALESEASTSNKALCK